MTIGFTQKRNNKDHFLIILVYFSGIIKKNKGFVIILKGDYSVIVIIIDLLHIVIQLHGTILLIHIFIFIYKRS